jgi:hypothetical protein
MENRVVVLEELIICGENYGRSGIEKVDQLIGFFRTCRYITKFKLTVSKNDRSPLASNLRKFLQIFNNLQELTIVLSRKNGRQDGIFDVIIDCCLNLRKLSIPRSLANEAQDYFCEGDLVIEYID